MITLDGATLEGGGQLVRVALALSAIRCMSIRVDNIRAGRASDCRGAAGLKESHLAALNWLANACGANVSDVAIKSQSFTFRPSFRRGQQLTNLPAKSTIELKKPGSVWLILQAILPFIIFSTNVPVLELTIKGGTNVTSSMSGEYVQQVLIPTLERIGSPKIEVAVLRRGWRDKSSGIGEAYVRVSRTFEPLPKEQGTEAALNGTIGFRFPGFGLLNRGEM
jgi:RNA 3'-terminal phosphate cyclase (ATP)